MTTTSRKLCRSGRRCEIRSFAEALDCVAHHSDLTLREIAERVGKSENYLRAACSQYDDSHKFQAELIVPLTIATGNFALLDYLEQAVGRVAIVLPRETTQSEYFDLIVSLAREFGEAATEVQRAVGDGHVTPEEADRVHKEIQDVHAAAAKLDAAIAAQVEQPGLRRVG